MTIEQVKNLSVGDLIEYNFRTAPYSNCLRVTKISEKGLQTEHCYLENNGALRVGGHTYFIIFERMEPYKRIGSNKTGLDAR